MNQAIAELAMTAMKHPQGREILELVGRMTRYAEPVIEKYLLELPRHLELEAKGVNTSNPQLVKAAQEYPERLSTAVEAWLKWADLTEVGYPTRSLVKAIKEDWRL